ncbi:uncharacterized protein [Rutidosis leptorrhynchoides]|uniref:uncharacterized protein n=1 Tax=Rutidosis leptorrhynchoides TaxID=125765 RepID=UPI003A9A0F72
MTNQEENVADRVTWSDGNCVFNWNWCRNLMGRASGDLQVLEGLIKSYTFHEHANDSWKWGLSSNGVFTTKKLQSIIEEKVLLEGRGHTATIKKQPCSKKSQVFIWRVFHNRIPVLIELDKRGVDLHSVRCPSCDDDIKTIEHSLVFCNKAFDLWTRIYKWWGLGTYSNLSFNETFKGNINGATSILGKKNMAGGRMNVWLHDMKVS